MFALRSHPSFVSLLVVLACGCTGGAPPGPGSSGSSGKADLGVDPVAPVCTNPASDVDYVLSEHLGVEPDEFIFNFTAWPVYDPTGEDLSVTVPEDVVAPIADRDAAREMLASRFPGCEEDVREHFARQPNVYVFFDGYGDSAQNNSRTFSPAILRWVNERDPEALIFAVNWSCAADPDPFCRDNAAAIQLGEGDPAFERMKATLEAAGVPAETFLGAAAHGSGEGSEARGYDEAMSSAIHLAARLVDQVLVAELGDVHFIGYSMGAQAAARVLTQDFVGDGSGYEWSGSGVCEDGGNTCTVAGLSRVGWALSLGLPGWSEALQAYNGFDAAGQPATDAAFRAQYDNGGLLRIADERFRNKLNVFNRRMDPTSRSDDVLYRAYSDSNFGEYNHYSHDYSIPLFIDGAFVRTLDRFLDAEAPEDIVELGIYFDHAGLVTFDECAEDEPCEASTGYYVHNENRAHDYVDIARTSAVSTTTGAGGEGLAASFETDESEPFALLTFDQEDLRGGVELHFRPAEEADAHGLFSYGGCDASDEDLMPEAVIEDGVLTFAMRYEGTRYEASADVSESLDPERFTHLAFTWELPTVSLTHEQAPDASLGLPGAVATGLMRALPTSYRRQAGEGVLRIFVDGTLEATAPLGTPDSARDCLTSEEVLNPEVYEVNGYEYEPFTPYSGYAVGTDEAEVGEQTGPLCKVSRVRNTEAFIGCARSDGEANAHGAIDNVVLIWGPGRTRYDNIGDDGTPQPWMR